MKKFFVLLTVAGMLLSTSCSESYDDSTLWGRVDDLENRVAQLEELCKQMNTNIASLQTLVSAVQARDYITSVVPVESGGNVVGYTITFSKNAPITIYHGVNGADGMDGKDGTDGKAGVAPVIGVKRDIDGIYYWTLDGKWLTDASGAKIPTSGANGQDGEDGVDGQPGQNGSDGAAGKDGQNGITPQLKIENDYWYVSYDEGKNWTQLEKAIPDNGASGAIFQKVASYDTYVLFTLTNGTEIRVPKFGALTITFTEGSEVLFDIGETKRLGYVVRDLWSFEQLVVKAEMLNPDNAYTLRIIPEERGQGIISVTSDIPTPNQIIVSVSDGKQTIMVPIRVGILPVFNETTITVNDPGTLSSLLADYDKSSISELTILGNLNSADIQALKNLPNLAILDLENVNLEPFPDNAFMDKTSLTSIKLPKALKTIKRGAFCRCSGLTGNLIIPESVTSIETLAFSGCSGLTGNLVLPAGITVIEDSVFQNCSGLTGDLIIPDGVTSIGFTAFYNCNNLTGKLVIPESVTSIGWYALNNHWSAVYCKAITPPTAVDSYIFLYQKEIPLYVPVGSVNAYRIAQGWSYFTNINEM